MKKEELKLHHPVYVIGTLVNIDEDKVQVKTRDGKLFAVHYSALNSIPLDYEPNESMYTMSFSEAIDYVQQHPNREVERRCGTNEGVIRMKYTLFYGFQQRLFMNDGHDYIWVPFELDKNDLNQPWRIVPDEYI